MIPYIHFLNGDTKGHSKKVIQIKEEMKKKGIYHCKVYTVTHPAHPIIPRSNMVISETLRGIYN